MEGTKVIAKHAGNCCICGFRIWPGDKIVCAQHGVLEHVTIAAHEECSEQQKVQP